MDIPHRYRHYSTTWRRLKRWQKEGVWKRILEALIAKGYSIGRLSLEKGAVDSTTVEARKGEARRLRWIQTPEGSKFHVAVSRETLPLSVVVGSGEEHDSKRFRDVMEGVKVKYGVRRSRSRPGEVYADQAYDTREIREYLRRRIKANIPVNPRNRGKPRRGRPYRLKRETYKRMRSCGKRAFAWLKSFRRITIRYERLKTTFLGLRPDSMHAHTPKGYEMDSLLIKLRKEIFHH